MSYTVSSRLASALGLIAVVLILLFAVPALGLKLGTVAVQPANTVTVTGFATSEEKNQVAVFSAGVSETNADRQVAVDAVNNGVNSLMESLKQFGIAEGDIKTQNLSLYQIEEPLFRGDMIVTEQNSVWQANNTVEVKLRDVSRAGELTNLLTSSGATNVYGPTFQLDVAGNPEDALISDAIDNAREKAAQIAESSGQKLGGVVNVSEGSVGGSPIYPMAQMARSEGGGGGAADIAVGTSTISKSMTVTFALRPTWYIWPW
jgi:uncharacterized protein YggE